MEKVFPVKKIMQTFIVLGGNANISLFLKIFFTVLIEKVDF